MQTHQELGITADEHAAMILTKELLKQEQMVFDMGRSCSVSSSNDEEDADRAEAGEAFLRGDSTAQARPFCDTACCIGGSMSLLMQNGMKPPATVTVEMGDLCGEYLAAHKEQGTTLHELFWGQTDPDTEPSEGIEAIDRFLEGNTTDPWLIYG